MIFFSHHTYYHFNLKFNISHYYSVYIYGLKIFAIKVHYVDDTYLVECVKSLLVTIPVTSV